MTKDKWYAAGLSFSCTECGKCCTGAPGYVWINTREMEEMARFLNLPLSTFKQKYVRRIGARYSLLESKTTYDCVFLKEGKCQVYKARPTQCRTYPWWPQNLKSPEAWKRAAVECEGIVESAAPIPLETIETQRLTQVERDADTR